MHTTSRSSASDRETIKLTRWLVIISAGQLFVLICQLLVFAYQARKLHETVKAAAQQTIDMGHSIEQAKRAADAMKEFAESAATNVRIAAETSATVKDAMTRQLRAYLCVNFLDATLQNRETNFRFQARVAVVNVGHSPGYKVTGKIRAAVLEYPLPQDFTFDLPELPGGSECTLGTNQHLILTGVVDTLISEQEENEVRSSQRKRLFLYGSVSYKDAYQTSRHTDFCLHVWLGDEKTMGFYTNRHNHSD